MFKLIEFTTQEVLRSSGGEVLEKFPQKEFVAIYNDEVVSEEQVASVIHGIPAESEVPDEIIILPKDVWDKLHEIIISFFSSVLCKIEADVKAKINRSPTFKLKSFESNRNDAFLEVIDIIKRHEKKLRGGNNE